MLRRTLIAFTFVGLGWAAARAAQTPVAPDFEMSVAATKDGQVTIECRRGCTLQYGRVAANRGAAQKTFTYGCKGGWTTCDSGPLQGWMTR